MRAAAILAASALTLAFSPTGGADGSATLDDGCGDTRWPVTVEGSPTVAQPQALAEDVDISSVTVDAGPAGTVLSIVVCGSFDDDHAGGQFVARWAYAPTDPSFDRCDAEVQIGTSRNVSANQEERSEHRGSFEASCRAPGSSDSQVPSLGRIVQQARVDLVAGEDFTVERDRITVTLDDVTLADAADLIAPGATLRDLYVASRTSGVPYSHGSLGGVATTRSALATDETDRVTVTVRQENPDGS